MNGGTERRRADLAWMAILVVTLLAGYVVAGNFGLSWDEPDNAAFGRQALQAYATVRAPAEWQSNLESKGPFFVAVAELLTPAVQGMHAGWTDVEARHFVYFLTLPLAATALYALARRIARPWAAWSGATLFLAQPLFVGHAFINPKDTPFMAFFLGSVALGVSMVEAMDPSKRASSSRRMPLALILLAGLALGLTTSIRIFGPFAGLLVSLLALARWRRRAFGPLALYWAAAVGSTFLTWPYLWGNPWARFWESFGVLVDFPWGNLVLYRGLVYNVKDLPWHYLPFITIVQWTESALFLGALGAVAGLVGLIKDAHRRILYAVFFLWAAVPYGAALLTHSEVYDNSRQFLFAQPPLFLGAALGFDVLFTLLRKPILGAALVVLAILPGAAGIVRLHPYEYIYYNQLVGGVPGAFRNYELDYWATSYRAAMERVNRLAPSGAIVEVVGPWLSAARFARPDLVVFKSGADRSDPRPPDFLMVLTRSNMDQRLSSRGQSIVTITVEGATLAEVTAAEATP